MTDLEKRRRQLLKRLATVCTRMDEIEAELVTHRDPDFAEQAVLREGDEVLELLGNSSEDEARMIRAALLRMEEDRYGICVSCGEPISEARLDAVPEAPLCRACAAGAD